MNIEQLKIQICDMIDAAYATAKREGHREIVHPFIVVIREDQSVEYRPYNWKQRKTNHAHV